MRGKWFRAGSDSGSVSAGVVGAVVAAVLGAGAAVSASVAIVQVAATNAESTPSATEPLVQYGDR